MNKKDKQAKNEILTYFNSIWGEYEDIDNNILSLEFSGFENRVIITEHLSDVRGYDCPARVVLTNIYTLNEIKEYVIPYLKDEIKNISEDEKEELEELFNLIFNNNYIISFDPGLIVRIYKIDEDFDKDSRFLVYQSHINILYNNYPKILKSINDNLYKY